jgi:hypothetical protein
MEKIRKILFILESNDLYQAIMWKIIKIFEKR